MADSRLVATVGQWWQGARPRTLPAAIAPVLVGTAAAYLDLLGAQNFAAFEESLSKELGLPFFAS